VRGKSQCERAEGVTLPPFRFNNLPMVFLEADIEVDSAAVTWVVVGRIDRDDAHWVVIDRAVINRTMVDYRAVDDHWAMVSHMVVSYIMVSIDWLAIVVIADDHPVATVIMVCFRCAGRKNRQAEDSSKGQSNF